LGVALEAPSSAGAKYPALPYIAPFATFIAFLMLEKAVPLGMEILYPIRLLVVTAVILLWSRGVLDFRVKNLVGTVLLGLAVFVIWVGPDMLWPGYRGSWLFTNSIMGHAQSSAPLEARSNLLFIAFRVAGSVLLVPVLEELFWRGWLARWLIDTDFRRVPLGAYTASSFWIGSLMFASEHGPFWEVGLIAGIAYNWWMCRTRSLGDCILLHAVTNGALSAYVLVTGQWQYWL
jgi:CAAX prenyl protease-like protein